MNGRPIDQAFGERFADEWIAAWNAHDIERVLAHYDDDFEMASPRIVEIVGEPSGVLRGKERVRAYWVKALGAAPDLHFDKLGIFVGARSVAIHYRSHRNRTARIALEVFEFDDANHVVRAANHFE